MSEYDAGYSLFLDADMLVLDDIVDLVVIAQEDEPHPVWMVKNARRFEWPSLMLFHNASCEILTPNYVNDESNSLYDLAWAGGPDAVGELPAEWNHCIGYDTPRKDARIVHYTQGIPCYEETADSEYWDEWHAELQSAMSTCSWSEIMADSVHAKPVLERYRKRQLMEAERGVVH